MDRTLLRAALFIAAIVLPLSQALAQSGPGREDARLAAATEVLQELRSTPDQNVPSWLLQRAYGVAVIPDVIKGAFVFGGRFGNGVLTVRNPSGRFSDPVFISLAGGSVGWQIGASSTDVVLVFMTPRSVQNFARGKFTLGVDASVAAGPLGRQGEAEAGVKAEIYSYSRSRGLFAGVALDGTVLAFDAPANRTFYGDRNVTTASITNGEVRSNSEAARRFLATVAAGVGAQTPPPTQAVAPAPAPNSTGAASSGSAQSFPLQDSHPGGEPQPQ